MSTDDPKTPSTPSTPSTPRERIWPSIPELLNRQGSLHAHHRNSSIVSMPSSPMETTMHNPFPTRETPLTLSMGMDLDEDFITTTPISPILDRVLIDAFDSKPHSSKSPLQTPPPPYHLTVHPSTSTTYSNSSPAYTSAVNHLALPLVPLISVTTGLPHPSFPRSLLQYHLLGQTLLDDLSRHYHQTDPPTQESFHYPCRVPGWVPPTPSSFTTTTTNALSNNSGSNLNNSSRLAPTLDTKRRRFGRFIGLQGCESPTEPTESEEGMVERMEREWQRRLRRAREEEQRAEKSWREMW